MSSRLLPILARVPNYIAYVAAALLCVLAVIYAIIFVYLQRDPKELTETYLADISAQYGVTFTVESMDITLLPLPAVALRGVLISGEDFTVTAAAMEVTPGFLPLLHGKIFPGHILIRGPEIHMKTDMPLRDPAEFFKSLAARFPKSEDTFTELPGSVRLEVEQMAATLTGADSHQIALANSRLDLRIGSSGLARGSLDIGSLHISDMSRQTIMGVTGASISGSVNCLDMSRDPASLEARGTALWRGVFSDLKFDANYEGHSSGWQMESKLEGDLDLPGARVPFALSGRAVRLGESDRIAIRNLEWLLDADSGTANLVLYWPGQPEQFALGGVLLIHRVSLTQWLGFARNLGPGLQIALDNIINGRLEFMLNAHSLAVPHVRATCSGATFTGTGGVASFAKPVVALNLTSPKANLGLGIPESVGETPPPIFFPHPTLTPMPGTPAKPGETGIGYDIRLAAELLRYGPLKINKAKVRIYPGKMDTNGLEDVLLDADGRFYGGSVNGHCILGGRKSLPIYITAKANKVNAAPLGRDMPILPMRSGTWNGSATVNTQGKLLHQFLGNMRGDLRVTAANATLAPTGKDNVLASLSTSSKLRGASWNGRHLAMDGSWQGAVSTGAANATGNLNGKLLFGADGLTFSNLPGAITVRPTKGILPSGSSASLSGTMSGISGKNRFEVAKGTLTLPGFTIHGDGILDAAALTARGKLQTTVTDPVASLAKMNIKASALPRILAPIKLRASYEVREDCLRLAEINSSLGKIPVTGTVQISAKGKKPLVEGNLQVGQIALADFVNKASTQSWDFRALTLFDAKGKVGCSGVNIYGQKAENLAISLTLTDGLLEIPQLTGKFYGAPVDGSLMANFNHGLDFNALLKINGFDLEQAARDRKLDIRLTGKASFQSALRARLSGKDVLTRKLQGQWQFTVFNGSWQTRAKNKPGSVTYFKNSSASGLIANGRVTTENFQLRGPELDLSGRGWFNLSSQNMEFNLNVDLSGLPAFPLRVYGSVSDVKTSIGAGKLLLNAVGEVATGIGSAIGSVFKGAWSIFRR